MNLESQVTSLETSKKLKALGVGQESHFKYCGGHMYYSEDEETHEEVEKFEECENDDLLDGDEYCHTAGMTCEYFVSAFTASELAEMLPESFINKSIEYWLTIEKYGGDFNVRYKGSTEKVNYHHTCWGEESLVEALAACLIHLKENKLI